MINIYSIPIIGEETFITSDKKVYHNGIKICDKEEDYLVLKLILKNFSHYIGQNKNLNEEISFNFEVVLIDRLDAYPDEPEDTPVNKNIILNFKVTQKKSRKFLCISMNKKCCYISKIRLDILLVQLSIFENNDSNIKLFPEMKNYSRDFLLSKGELNSYTNKWAKY